MVLSVSIEWKPTLGWRAFSSVSISDWSDIGRKQIESINALNRKPWIPASKLTQVISRAIKNHGMNLLTFQI